MCHNAIFAAKAPAVGNYFFCGFDNSAHKGNEECTADKKVSKSGELRTCRRL